MQIVKLTHEFAAEVRSFVADAQTSHDFHDENAVSEIAQQLLDSPASEKICLGAVEQDKLQAIGCLGQSVFDSSIYNLQMGEITRLIIRSSGDAIKIATRLVQELLVVAVGRNFDHLSCLVDVENVPARIALEVTGFHLMDTSVQYKWQPMATNIKETENSFTVQTPDRSESCALRIMKLGVRFRESNADDLPRLQEIAGHVFTTDTLSRYALDPNLPLERTRTFYAEWIKNAVKGAFGDFVAVATVADRPIGFQVFRRDKGTTEAARSGSMGIGAVDQGSRGSGTFPSLLAVVLAWCRQQNIGVAVGRTLLNNLRMHRSCAATGGVITGGFHSFHKLLRD